MIQSPTAISDGSTVEADLCIIGSGPGAFSLALPFVDGAPKNRPLKVVMLESQSAEQPFDLFTRGLDPSQGPCDVTQLFYPGVREGILSDRADNYLTFGRKRVYGGTSDHWGGWSWPLQPWDLASRPFHQDAEWPIDFEELDAYYHKVLKLMRLNHFEFDNPDFWIETYGDQQELEAMPLPSGSPLQTRILQFKRVQFADQYGDLLSTSPYVDLYRNANALHFVTTHSGDRRQIASLEVGSLDTQCRVDRIWRVKAERYAVCCGGIESTRLLLLNDLGNQSGRLGRTFMDHPYLNNFATYTLNESVIPQGVRNFYFNDRELTTGPPFCSTFIAGLVPTEAYLNANPELGDFRLLMGAVTGRNALAINTEQAPAFSSTISLATPEEMPVDLFGQRRVKVDWQSQEVNGVHPDTITLRRSIDLAREVLQDELGYVSDFRVADPDYTTKEWWEWTNGRPAVGPGLHPSGSTRMSADPKDGVVNPDLRVHDTENLYVVSSSTFPTQGYQNPTFTICALGRRLADHILANPA